jgi:hypothetical protein
VIVNLADVTPAEIVTVAGTVARGLELLSVTTAPAGGAIPFIVTVALVLTPPTTEPGLRESALNAAGLMVRGADLIVPLNDAEMLAVTGAVTAAVVIWNVAVVAAAGTVTETGTLADGVELERLTSVPPAGAAAERVTVLVATEAPPTTADAPSFTLASAIPKRIDTAAVASGATETPPIATSGQPTALAVRV